MGIASSYFYDANNSDKQTLHRRIRPTEDQFEEQQERWNLLADHLVADLKTRSQCSIKTWLQGSYKFGTQIRPASKGQEFDIDLGVYFNWGGTPEDGDHSAIDLKSMVQKSLQSYSAESVLEIISPPKARCSRMRFQGDFHIDVPAYHLDESRDARTLATQEGIWEDSDPKALYLWFKNKFDDYTRDKTRRQIRYIKIWASLKFPDVASRPSSVLLTVLVAEVMQNLSDEKKAADDELLVAVIGGIRDRLKMDSKVVNPVQIGEILSGRLNVEAQESFSKALQTFCEIGERALACESLVSSLAEWAEAFEHFVPMPEIEEAAQLKESQGQLPALLNVPDVRVVAVSKDNPQFRREGINRIGPIPKNCTITFELKPETVPYGAEVKWTVRNENEEAESENDLGHKAGTGFAATERSAYIGVHYMDCEFRRYGQLIGLRRIPVEVTGIFVPRRNLNKKPFWKGIAGRR